MKDVIGGALRNESHVEQSLKVEDCGSCYGAGTPGKVGLYNEYASSIIHADHLSSAVRHVMMFEWYIKPKDGRCPVYIRLHNVPVQVELL